MQSALTSNPTNPGLIHQRNAAIHAKLKQDFSNMISAAYSDNFVRWSQVTVKPASDQT
jgi:hypothetical protein